MLAKDKRLIEKRYVGKKFRHNVEKNWKLDDHYFEITGFDWPNGVMISKDEDGHAYSDKVKRFLECINAPSLRMFVMHNDRFSRHKERMCQALT